MCEGQKYVFQGGHAGSGHHSPVLNDRPSIIRKNSELMGKIMLLLFAVYLEKKKYYEGLNKIFLPINVHN